MKQLEIFDTTLRDGAQGENVSFSVADKLNILKALAAIGIPYVEAGNPGSNPRDAEFFNSIRGKEFGTNVVAFGSTRRRGIRPEEDGNCLALLGAETETVAIFGKGWLLHVTDVLHTTPEENLAMIRDTVAFFVKKGKRVFYDAEHFFDGYLDNPEYAMATLRAAEEAGAERLILCDTNGGTFPETVAEIVQSVSETTAVPLGIHCHNDTGCAVAASLAAVEAGAVQVQGTFLGIGERCGNANLSTLIGDLQLKKGYACIPEEKMPNLTSTARYLADISNIRLSNTMPYVGQSAFSHKGGMHIDGVMKNSRSFEHIPPEEVGNNRNILVSDVAGRSALAEKLAKIDGGLARDSEKLADFAQNIKQLEYEGFQFESAAASMEIRALKYFGGYRPFFTLCHFKTIGEQPAPDTDRSAAAVVKIKVGDRYEITAEEGDGPVHALDKALKKALSVFYPEVGDIKLVDYKVRVIDSGKGAAAMVRVLIESTDGEAVWTTVGASTDIIDASWQALVDSIEYKLLKENGILQ
ncbi:MAG TPA: citramalate synthase [Oscillospiraceae bacterium]|nr:citramalate synthase [Oscillospiraceae bacterium]